MITEEIKFSLRLAIEELRIAEHELNRPTEDVVTMSVCFSAKTAMSALMRMYLLGTSGKSTDGRSLEELLNHCRKQDRQFEMINLATVFCNNLEPHECDQKYCLSAAAVQDCIDTANQIKKIVLSKLQLNELELVS